MLKRFFAVGLILSLTAALFVADGMLAPPADTKALLLTTAAFADYELKLSFRTSREGILEVLVNCDREGKRWTYNRSLRSPDTKWWTLIVKVKDGVAQEETRS